MRVLMIRHGQTEGNRVRRYVGALDEPLCAEGIQQVRSRGVFPGMDRVYTSALTRTVQTAGLLFPGARIIRVAAFNEQNFGVYQGRSYASVMTDPDLAGGFTNDYALHFPGGESAQQVIDRVRPAFARVLQQETSSGAERCLFVVHAGTIISVMMSYAEHQRGSYYDWHEVGNACGRLFEIDTRLPEAQWKITRQRLVEDFSVF